MKSGISVNHFYYRKCLIKEKIWKKTWEQRKLGMVCDSFEYGLNVAATDYDGKNKYIRITDIDDNSHEFLQDDVTSSDTMSFS